VINQSDVSYRVVIEQTISEVTTTAICDNFLKQNQPGQAKHNKFIVKLQVWRHPLTVVNILGSRKCALLLYVPKLIWFKIGVMMTL
jgi:hypothetical protein